MAIKPEKTEKEMSFLQHLEELRWHLMRAFSSIFVFFVIAFASKDFVVSVILLGPSRPNFLTYRLLCQISSAICIEKLPFVLQSRSLAGQFTAHLVISLVIGLIAAFPYAFWEIWRFVKPGLYHAEQSSTRGATFMVSFLFLTGIVFGYFVVAPLSINFLANYQLDPSIVNEIDILSYMSTLAIMVLACGLMFQLPVAIYFLSRIGFVTPSLMRNYRRHSIVVILFLSALLTPSPDVISQLLVAVPLFILYELSIYISAWVEKSQTLIEAEQDKKEVN
jgi:sec-independent protein translocase protein TatC